MMCPDLVPDERRDERIVGRIKTPPSIIDKVEREFPDRTFRSLDELDGAVRDIAAGKIVVSLADQVEAACERIRASPLWEVSEDTPRHLDSGFRAHKFDLLVRRTARSEAVWFEVQVRTVLQDVWDYYQHPMYERIRRGDSSEDIARRMRWVSELFFTIEDMVQDAMREIHDDQ